MNEASRIGYREKKITDLQELKLLVWGMELDEGIRFVADMPPYENGAFVFLTKSGGRFIANAKERVYDEASRNYIPGSKEEWKYFDKPHEVWNFVTKLLKPQFEAFYY
ncbi:MAG: hypothetical protein JRN52_09465 [Nitrososphaerota archaeon]|nr:hypothetical protein [Nitrososphaerota archaeon]